MIKQRNEPVIDVTLSYTDIELILTSLEHYVPQSQDKTEGVTLNDAVALCQRLHRIELLSLMRRYERRLFNLKAEREIDQDWFLSDTAWEDYYNDKQIEA